MSKAHLVVGMTDTGKSFYVKNLLRKVPNKQALYIFDYQDEYNPEFIDYGLIPFEDFAYNATLLRNAVIVIEEASIFLGSYMSNTDKLVNDVLISKKHRKNYVFLLFHAVSEIPPYIYRKCNFITLFKTNDLPDLSARELRDVRLRDIMERVKSNKNIHYNETLRIL